MKTPLSTSVVVGMAATLVACVTNPATTGRDISGTTTHHTDWRTVAPSEAVINIVDLKGSSEPRFRLRTEHRIRDNELVQQKIHFDVMTGYIGVEHTTAFFDYASTRHVNDPGSLKAGIDEFYGHPIQDADYEESRRIYSRGARGGWLHVVGGCIFAGIGFLDESNSRLWTEISADEHYDTIVDFRDCSGTRTADDVEAFLDGLKIVPPEYNRTVVGEGR